jgi:hypothetical protein
MCRGLARRDRIRILWWSSTDIAGSRASSDCGSPMPR